MKNLGLILSMPRSFFKENKMKPLQLIKTVLYILAGIAVVIFNNEIMESLGVVVGIVVICFGVDYIIMGITHKKYFGETGLFFPALTYILLGVILFIVTDDIKSVCLVWAVWAILREGKELSESIHRLTEKKPGLINALESVVIIIFSFTMIMEPGEHHAHVHVFLLGGELILEVLFPIANMLFDKYIEKKVASAEGVSQD